MKLTIVRKDLINPLKMVNGAVEPRQTLPILGNTLVEVKEQTLYLTATDAEIEISCCIPLDAENEIVEGRTTIPARKFLDICRSLNDSTQIEIQTDAESRVSIKSGRSRFTLSTLNAEEFPTLSADKQSETTLRFTFSVAQRTLRDLLAQTQFSMAQQDVRYYLNGLLFDLMPGELAVVATDGHRLAMAKETFTLEGVEPTQVIIPRKAVNELARMLNDNADAQITVSVYDNYIKFSFADRIVLSSKLIDGRFPDYRGVIPAYPDKFITTSCDVLKQSLSRASILSNEKYKGVRLSFNPQRLIITARNPEQEEAEEELEVDYDGEAFEIGFNVTYLLDVLNAIMTKEVELCFGDINASCLIKPKEIEHTKYVIMPMRL
ncbi:DNA polymerase III subunit beta [Beggiatoa leptomitoformis]|uniref:Beta sliding clamp n=1 Tax=Beggiatoa leptomitoformis TaxID=288004 RepID=A0A2N9YCK0_9GAMM|nr:DNA polymerase III subunit beta [Beggiatoa leptomitoformis]ALG66557.1 DNA polymerase III subunit beta [Beggiatoa leptomitoformis]AUI68144.1 DNA polymerase III subunit beta [Beggiatoa leptomitoformis]